PPAANKAAAPMAPVRKGANAAAVELDEDVAAAEAEDAPAPAPPPSVDVGTATPEVNGTSEETAVAPEKATD
ncbi:MAG: hypothetical protein Q9187_009180, partial [Circinaria calcarea]